METPTTPQAVPAVSPEGEQPPGSAVKIVIVEGQEFTVQASIDNETIRHHLAASFPNVASAAIETGTRTIAGITYETVAFV